MVKVDLITGFLGSGKTTFLKRYARFLMDKGMNIGILENDYGAVNVDMMLLQELRGENCELEMVAGGCDADCHRRRFKTKLISMGMCGYDRVLIEPSGIFDMDEFFDALYEEPLCRWYQIGNVISIVDAGLEQSLSEQSEYLLGSQIADAGMVVLSHCQDTEAEEISETISHMNRALEKIHCRRRLEKEILCKDWNNLNTEDWEQILSCGYCAEDFEKLPLNQEKGYSSLYFMNLSFSEDALSKKIKQLFQESVCGHIFRVKGFYRQETGQWMELNATRKSQNRRPIAEGQEILIVIGENLNENKINEILAC